MRHFPFAFFCLSGALSAGAGSSAQSAEALLWATLDRSDLFEFDGRIGTCMDAKLAAVKQDTTEFVIRRKSAPCPIPKPSSFKVVLSKGVVLESESGMALEGYAQGRREERKQLAPAWTRSEPEGSPVCDDDPTCGVITAGGGGSLKKR